MINLPLDSDIEQLNLGADYLKLLKESNIILVRDLWCKTIKDLRELKFSDKQIRYLSLKLQLWGLDLGKKMYE